MSAIVFPDLLTPKLAEMLTEGSVGVLKTDTLYGLVARADNKQAVERIYDIKQRDDSKPLIVLISNISQLYDPLPESIDETVNGLWPGKNSIVLPAPSAPEWLVRGSQGVCYRMPDDARLRQLIDATGPLVAPSANPQGQTPARSVGEAQGYFDDRVDFYVDGGVAMDSQPSSVYILTGAEVEQIR